MSKEVYYVIRTPVSRQPNSRRNYGGEYRHVVLCEVDNGYSYENVGEFKHQRIIDGEYRLYVGKTKNCAYARALREMEEKKSELEAENDV